MKTKYILIGLFVAVAVALYFILRKVQGALLLDYSFGAPKPVGTWLESLKSLIIRIPITIKNHSKEKYTITALKADMLTRTGGYIASQTVPFSNPLIILPQKNTVINLEYGISITGVTRWLKEENVKLTDVPKKIKTYLQTEMLNIPVVLSGGVEAEGITIMINKEIML